MAIERNPKDSRLRYTKECIYKSFLRLLAEKPVNEITVIEICEQAGVSRKTFYKYYSDQFDLLRAMQDELFEGYRERLSEMPANVFDIAPALIRFADENRVLIKAAFANQGEGNFVDKITDDMFATYRQDWIDANPKSSEQEVEALFFYVVSGLIGVVRHWLFAQPDRTADDVIADARFLMRISDPARKD